MAYVGLGSLSPELLHEILVLVRPSDLRVLPRVCRALNNFIRGNQALFRAMYLNLLDKPPTMKLDWEEEMKTYIRLQHVCSLRDVDAKKSALPFVYNAVERLLKNASSTGEVAPCTTTHAASRNVMALKRLFSDEINQTAFMQRSHLFQRVRAGRLLVKFEDKLREDHQQSAKLHCLHGSPLRKSSRISLRRINHWRAHPYACSKVYDTREHTRNTKWGPFRDDESGKVDWEKVEAILVVLFFNMRDNCAMSQSFNEAWSNPFSGAWSGSYLSTLPPEPDSLAARDPYGITGIWYRVVCFLDYHDFFSFNFPVNDGLPRDTPRPPLHVGDETRLIVMKLWVTSMEPPGPEDGQDLPVVHFAGTSQALDDSWTEHNAPDTEPEGRVDARGTVRLSKEGEVRWTITSIFDGQERWRSECVQVGGVRSARGVVGNWFARNYDEHRPVGPTALWKVNESGNLRDVLRALVPDDFTDPEGGIEDTEMENDDDDDDDFLNPGVDNDDDDAADEVDAAQISTELPGLLHDAQMDLGQVTGGPAGA